MMFGLKSLPIQKQSYLFFLFYVASSFLAICLEVWWGFNTPSLFDEDGSLVAFGFFFISFVEVVFLLLAMRHVDAAEKKFEKSK